MSEIQPSNLNETDSSTLPSRLALLPWWIIFFCWMLIIIKSVLFIAELLRWYRMLNMDDVNIVWKHYMEFQDIFSPANALFTIFAAFGLLTEKNWAINIAIANAFANAFDILYTPLFITKSFAEYYEILQFLDFWFYYWGGLILIIIYVWKLISIRKEWNIRQPAYHSNK